jgi:hypothetical protein
MLRSRWVAVSAVLAWGIVSLPISHAQETVLAQLYGTGVHAYFAGDYQQAMTDFTTVADAGTNDPRVYYFRGLASKRLGGNPYEDFARGAELEAKTIDRFYPVSRSLERVQGSDRVALERYRAQARAAAYQEKQRREQARYEELRRAEDAVLRATPPPAVVPDQPPPSPVVGEAAPVTQEGTEKAPAPAAAPTPAEENPFGDDAPIAAPPSPPGEDADAAPESPPAGEEDIFGIPADANEEKEAPPDDNPFADDADAPTDEDSNSAKDKDNKSAEDENPFGT